MKEIAARHKERENGISLSFNLLADLWTTAEKKKER